MVKDRSNLTSEFITAKIIKTEIQIYRTKNKKKYLKTVRDETNE